MANRTEMAKLVDGRLKYAKKTVVIGGMLVYNPSELELSRLGYKVVVQDRPQVDEDHYLRFLRYDETEDAIICRYEAALIEREEDSEA